MEKETSCINTRAVLDYLKAHYPGDYAPILKNLDPELDACGDPEKYLRDPNNWVSCAVISKLYARSKILLKDEMAPYKMAQHAMAHTTLGYAQRTIVKSLWSLKKLLKNAQKVNDKWNRNKRVEVVSAGKKEAVIRLHWDPQMDSSRDICLYNQGAYASMPLIWGGQPLKLSEKCCYFDGASYCEYHVHWTVTHQVHGAVARLFKKKSVLMETIAEMEKDKQVIEQKFEEVNQLNTALNQKVKELEAIHETGKAILTILDQDRLLSVIMNILAEVCRINRALIMLVNEKTGRLEYLHGAGFGSKMPPQITNYTVPLQRMENIMSRVAHTGQPEYVPKIENSTLRQSNVILSLARPTSAFVVPLVTHSKVIGVMATDAVDDNGVPAETRETLEVFAPQIAIAIQNAKLYSRLRQQMQELKASHTLLKRAEKLTFLGNLAARLAHEIKNPMTAIGTFLQMLPHKYDDEEFRNDFYAIAMEETGRINNLITELLDLTRTRESHFEFGDVNALIKNMILLVSPQTNAKQISVDFRADTAIAMVEMDAEKIKEVILNILSNAVDFTPTKGRLEVTTRQAAENGQPSAVQIAIRDTGPGIDPALHDKTFDPFFTTKHRSNMHNGTGLGLFIAHQNMIDHNGGIEVITHKSGGTSFVLTLPFTAAPAGETAPVAAQKVP